MLVLSRKISEQIQIGSDITLTIRRIKGNTVKIGVEAPRNISVRRGEITPFPQADGEATCDSATSDKEHCDGDDPDIGDVGGCAAPSF